MRVWIVGGTGLLGTFLAAEMRGQGIIHLSDGSQRANLLDPQQLLARATEVQPTHIICAAAYTKVDQADHEKEKVMALNAEGPERLAILARDLRARLLYISTDYVFSGEQETPYHEEDPTHPVNLYGASKLEGERRVLAALPTAAIVRTSWLFGREGHSFASALLNLLLKEERVYVVEDQIGTPTYCPALAKGLVQLLSYSFSGVIHFAGQPPVSRYQFALALMEELKRLGIPFACREVIPVSSDFFKNRASRPKMSALAVDRWQKEFGEIPPLWRDGLRIMLGGVNA